MSIGLLFPMLVRDIVHIFYMHNICYVRTCRFAADRTQQLMRKMAKLVALCPRDYSIGGSAFSERCLKLIIGWPVSGSRRTF